jgi:hypothetical protein
MHNLPPHIQQGISLPELPVVTTKGDPCRERQGLRPTTTIYQKGTTMNSFTFDNAVLKSVKDYDSIMKGIVQSRQATINPDGTVRYKFVASRQVTFQDPELLAQLRERLATNSEFKVNLSGFMTTTVREQADGKSKWYDNQVVTQLEFLA